MVTMEKTTRKKMRAIDMIPCTLVMISYAAFVVLGINAAASDYNVQTNECGKKVQISQDDSDQRAIRFRHLGIVCDMVRWGRRDASKSPVADHIPLCTSYVGNFDVAFA